MLATTLLLLAGSAACVHIEGRSPASEKQPKAAVIRGNTRVFVVGSGTPVADPTRGGPSTAVLVGDRAVVVDAGANVLRGLAAMEIDGLAPERVDRVFLTHLHSDHTLGLDELLLGAWVIGRTESLHVYGPPGADAMVDHLRAAFAQDRRVRTEGLEGAHPRGDAAEVHIVEPGVVFEEGDLRVRAFPVSHGSWTHAFGYRIEGPDRVVVISGDTAPSDAVVEACSGCDVLVHEVYSGAAARRGSAQFRAYHGAFHTSAEELGQLAARARPRLLVLTHALFFDSEPSSLLEEVRAGFDGEVVLAEDGAEY